jgi:hypothetical protein
VTDSDFVDTLFAGIESALSTEVDRLKKSTPSPSEQMTKVNSALDLLIEFASADAKAARELSGMAGAVGLLGVVAPESTKEQLRNLELTLDAVRYHADLWDGLAKRAREVKASLEANVKADRGQMIDVGEQLLETIRELHKATPSLR